MRSHIVSIPAVILPVKELTAAEQSAAQLTPLDADEEAARISLAHREHGLRAFTVQQSGERAGLAPQRADASVQGRAPCEPPGPPGPRPEIANLATASAPHPLDKTPAYPHI